MPRYLLILTYLLCTCLTVNGDETLEEIFTTPQEQAASLSCPSDFLVGGVLHPISGQLSIKAIDLIAKGAQDIQLERTYFPGFAPLKDPKKSKCNSKNERSTQ